MSLTVSAGETVDIGQVVGGVAGTYIYQGGVLVSSLTGVLSESDVTVLSGGVVNVTGAGVESGGTVSFGGLITEAAGGVASGVTVVSGGFDYVSAGGEAIGSILDTSGFQYVFSGIASATQVDNGGEVVFNGAISDGAVVTGSLGYQDALGGATVSGTIIEIGGDELINPGANVFPLTLQTGGLVALVGVQGRDAFVDSSGNLEVTSNGTLVATIPLAPGSSDAFGFSVLPAGTALGSAGGEFLVDLADTPGGAVTISGLRESIDVASGQIDNGASLSAYAIEKIENGGQSLGAIVSSQGIQVVRSGGLASGSVVASGGFEGVYSGSQVDDLTLEPGATLYFYGAASASGYVNASNQLVLTSGGSVVETIGLSAATYGLHVSRSTDGFDDTILTISRSVTDDFNGDGRADILIENTNGAVVVGEIGSSGQETYTQVAALGPEWSFVGTGDFYNDGNQGFMIENTNGAVVVGEVSSGVTTYTQVGALGPEWSFVGAAHPSDDSDQILIENTNGAVVDGQVQAGDQLVYSQVAALGPEWSFKGTGDFLGDGRGGALIENTNGAVVVGESNGSGVVTYTQVAALGPEWKFVGTGAFLGGGQAEFLIENTSGAVVLGQVLGGQAQYTQIGGLGPEWNFVGVGDYYGTGTDSFMIENTSGALVTGTVVAGHAQYASVGALGPEWTFHG